MKNVRDLLARLSLLCRLEAAIVDELDRLNERVYALEENRKLKDASIVQIHKDIGEMKMILRNNESK